MARLLLALAALSLAAMAVAADGAAAAARPAPGTELRLWPGRAPGSESWRHAETVTTSPAGDRIIRNVTDPTLSVFLPTPDKANGTAIVIAPGGALRLLGFDNEGVKLARWLNERGIAAFVLKYRTLQLDPALAADAPSPRSAASPAARQEIPIRNANANPAPDDRALAEVLKLAIADAQASMRLVRRQAPTWQLDPRRIGLLGFSAGGGVAVGVALAPASEASPDFLVSVYGPSLMDVHPRPDAPPLFVAVGSAHFNVTRGCLALFDAWRAAGRPAELHVYDGVTAGFGMTPRGLPVDGWKDRLYEWLTARDLVRRVQ